MLERATDELLYDFATFTSDNAVQRESATRLTSNFERRFAYLSALIGVRAERDFAAVAETKVGFGSAEMKRIHATLKQMKNEEKRLLALRIEDRDHHNEILEWSLALLVLGGIAVMGLVFLHMNRLWLARKEAEARAIHLANHDVLTGLPNRRMLSDRIAVAIAHAARYQENFAVLCFDLDGFKTVNDEHGHDAGDQLLNLVATRIRKPLRAVDTVARVGGDEFVALLVHLTKVEDSATVADKLLQYLCAPYTLFGQVATVGTSIGIALYPMHGTTSEELLRRADMALYEAKVAGKGCYAIARDDSAHGIVNPRSRGRLVATEPLVEAS
jgi:diguanylate cyclase (GGDEF)-like protein